MRRKRRLKKRDLHRGVYVLPNIFTSLNLFIGFYAVICAIQGKFATSAWAILAAGVCDALDGKVARATHTSSKFGVEYDSLADLVSFGMAPAILAYLWALQPLGRLGWLAGFLFLACGALRLARFNTQVGVVNSDRFMGLPIPAAAGMTATIVLLSHRLAEGQAKHPMVILVMIFALSFLMVSTIRYHSFKNPRFFRWKSFNSLVATILVLILIAAEPSLTLFSIGLAYMLSGPLLGLRPRREAPSQEEVRNGEEPTKTLI